MSFLCTSSCWGNTYSFWMLSLTTKYRMKWTLSCHVKMKLCDPAGGNLCQLFPRCPADSTMCSQSHNAQHGETKLHQRASFKQYGGGDDYDDSNHRKDSQGPSTLEHLSKGSLKIKSACNNLEFKRRTAVTFSGWFWAAAFLARMPTRIAATS